LGLHDLGHPGFQVLHEIVDQAGGLGSERCEAVLDPRRDGRHDVPQHESVALERLQGLRQHLLAHPLDPPAQRAEAERPVTECEQGEAPPPAGDVLERGPRGAVAPKDIEGQFGKALIHGCHTIRLEALSESLHFPKVSVL
jgi:hypothetical protein